MASAPVLLTEDLTVTYGKHRGISDVSLAVHSGEVYGFLGPNGAGKTTTLRVLMDVIQPDSGRAAIFGLDCQADGHRIRERVGYLPGELKLYDALTGREYLNFVARAYGRRVARADLDHLIARLDLDPARRMRQYSRGNKQKVGLVAAFMHHPDLLILDEPTSGLDPLVQQTVLDLVREAQADGRTVFFSSHNLHEVQAVCDRVGIIRGGELTAVERVEDLVSQQFRRLRLTLGSPPPADAFGHDGVVELSREGRTVVLEVQRDSFAPTLEAALPFGIVDLETLPVTLEETFFTYYGDGDNA